MLKPHPRIIQPWAWIILLIMPYLLMVPMFWYMINDSAKVSAVLAILNNAAEDGSLKQPDVHSLAITFLGGSTPSIVLVTCICVAVLMILAIIFVSRRPANVQQPST